MQKVTPFLWFNGQAEEAMQFYVNVFTSLGKKAKVLSSNPMGGMFEIEGQQIMTLNGGPEFKLTEAFSLYVDCATQKEVDDFWEALSAGGAKSRCGWLKDKFGLSWQIIPSTLWQLMRDPNPAKSKRVFAAMMKMDKIIIADLQKAYDQE